MQDRRRFKGRVRIWVAGSVAAIALLSSCSIGVKSYEEFRSAVDSGANCSQLWDIKKNFKGSSDERRIELDLQEIGCRTPSSTRSDA
jgi:hypothetical protein